MLIAKKGKPLMHVFVENLPDENLEIAADLINKRLQAREQAKSEKNDRGKNGGK